MEKRSALETIIDILNSDLGNTTNWLKQAIQELPREYGSLLIFNTLTGLRGGETCVACGLITKLSEKQQLHRYLDEGLMMLQHFRFKNLFLRRNKNAYISFASEELLGLVQETKPLLSYSALRHKLNRLNMSNKTKQLRKLYATRLRNYLPHEIIDLLQGRVSQSVFLRFYYKPFLQDIRAKVLKGIEPLQTELFELLSQLPLFS